MEINWKFIARGTMFAIVILLVLLVVGVQILHILGSGPPDGPLPPPATMAVSAGELPADHVGLSEWAVYEGEGERLVGSGFFFALPDGTIIGATTAHSVSLGRIEPHLDQIVFTVPGSVGTRYAFDTFYGTPGKPRWGRNMNGDYVLLQVDQGVDPDLVLTPDPRGEPQPGERVALYSGLSESTHWGIVHTVDENGMWLLMDKTFDPGRMSGSPILSAHTGQLIGMALAAAEREIGLFIGASTVGNLVSGAREATAYPLIHDYDG